MARKLKGYIDVQRGGGKNKGTVYVDPVGWTTWTPYWNVPGRTKGGGAHPENYNVNLCYKGWRDAGGPKLKPKEKVRVTLTVVPVS